MSVAETISAMIDADLRAEIAAECAMLRGGPVTAAALDDMDARRDGAGPDAHIVASHAPTHGRAANATGKAVATRTRPDPLAPRGSRPCRHCLEERSHEPGPCPHCGRRE